ncbi:MAG: hypothetical protein IJR54_07485 [Oscillibacter sp.]|nr:hypothetical protein [Oscillibacter sp.]
MKRHQRGSATLIIVGLVVLLAVTIGAGTFVIVRLLNRDEVPQMEPTAGLNIGYASEGVTVLDEADAQQQAINDLLRGGPGLSIDYKGDAYSVNGKDFECYIGNSDVNTEDMYIQICADAEMTDTVFLSQLIRPGYAFRNITLDRAFPNGDYTFYVCFTTVNNSEDGEVEITGQTTVAVDFHVQTES